MRKSLFTAILVTAFLFGSPSPSGAQATTWQIDPAHSAATFAV